MKTERTTSRRVTLSRDFPSAIELPIHVLIAIEQMSTPLKAG